MTEAPRAWRACSGDRRRISIHPSQLFACHRDARAEPHGPRHSSCEATVACVSEEVTEIAIDKVVVRAGAGVDETGLATGDRPAVRRDPLRPEGVPGQLVVDFRTRAAPFRLAKEWKTLCSINALIGKRPCAKRTPSCQSVNISVWRQFPCSCELVFREHSCTDDALAL